MFWGFSTIKNEAEKQQAKKPLTKIEVQFWSNARKTVQFYGSFIGKMDRTKIKG